MKIRVMCAVPFRSALDSTPPCIDGRGGQIYNNATPGFSIRDPSDFWVAVAVSFLLEYEQDEREVSHLEYIVGTASLDGTIIGVSQNDFVLNPFAPLRISTRQGRVATYENVPLDIKCSSAECGLIELLWALKVDTVNEPVKVLDRVFVRNWINHDQEGILSSKAYDQWLNDRIRARLRENRY